ncbi:MULTISPECIES: hypothetical protein [unclassified Arthrobacter]|nr:MULTISPECIES: hypothetical protein [unclassified Arthrobacter]MEC5193536.1 hypothetical protein [Arthrobacter sp. MP_M4]MEC5205013.1 hypothetical protein [Arthrobacter sp. MP_M7]
MAGLDLINPELFLGLRRSIGGEDPVMMGKSAKIHGGVVGILVDH